MRQSSKIIFAAVIALALGVGATVLLAGLSSNEPLRTVQIFALIILTAIIIFSGAVALGLKMASWQETTSEEEFDDLVARSEELAAQYSSGQAGTGLDPLNDSDFELIVAAALDDLPVKFQQAIGDNLAITIADNGRDFSAYGLYRGGGARSDLTTNQILIFRDTLRRDFAFDSELLRQQITRVVRHEVAHHLGFDEPGVRSLGL